MADTFNNPYTPASPFGAALARLGSMITSGPSEADRIKAAEQALALKNKREGIAALGDVFGQYGQPGFDRNAAMRAAIYGEYDPQNLAEMERYGAANTFGAQDKRTTNAFVGAGGSYSGTYAGFSADQARMAAAAANALAENRRQFDMKPYEVMGPEGPTISTNRDAVGKTPILSMEEARGSQLQRNFGKIGDLPAPEQRVLGAGSGAQTPRNYITPTGNHITYDGIHDAMTGAMLPPGGHIGNVQGSANDTGLTNTTKTDLQRDDLSNDKFSQLLGYTEDLVRKDASNIGAAGLVKDAVQNATQLASNLAGGLGFTGVQDAIESVRQRAVASGVSPGVLSGIFDPNLPRLSTAYGLLVYSAAEALAGQSGRSVTDADVKRVQAIVGDPQSLFATQQSTLAKFGALRDILGMNQAANARALGKAPAAPAPATPQAVAPAPAPAPAAPAAAPAVKPYVPGTPLPSLAIQKLKLHPDQAADFDALFGAGAAAAVLGQ